MRLPQRHWELTWEALSPRSLASNPRLPGPPVRDAGLQSQNAALSEVLPVPLFKRTRCCTGLCGRRRPGAVRHIHEPIFWIEKAMRICRCLALMLVLHSFSLSAPAASAVHKCVIKGAVIYQQDPCPRNAPRQDPTVELLNLEEKKRREAVEGGSGSYRASAVAGPTPTPTPTRPPAKDVNPLPGKRAAAYTCDGRTHCSQMSSCAEAKYFLANCPGVKMDGDKNGIPCEQQWCNR
jgi:Excalibur calcium-binding domain